MLLQELSNSDCVLLMGFHSHSRCFQTTQNQPGVKRRLAWANGILIEEKFFLNLIRVKHDGPSDHIIMTVNELCHAVKYHVRSEVERILKVSTHEGIFQNCKCADFFRHGRNGANVRDLKKWV